MIKFYYNMAPNPMKGHPDIAGVFDGGGYFVCECKTGTGRLEPKQIEWRDKLQAKGVTYVLVRSLDDLAKAFACRTEPLTKSEMEDALESLPDISPTLPFKPTAISQDRLKLASPPPHLPRGPKR